MNLTCEHGFDLKGESQKLIVRIYAPERCEDGPSWRCFFEIGPPFEYDMYIYGESSLQALALAISGLSATLYGSESYRSGLLGSFGHFGGYLGIPAPGAFLDVAPFPF
jgi:hypothetical protein